MQVCELGEKVVPLFRKFTQSTYSIEYMDIWEHAILRDKKPERLRDSVPIIGDLFLSARVANVEMKRKNEKRRRHTCHVIKSLRINDSSGA